MYREPSHSKSLELAPGEQTPHHLPPPLGTLPLPRLPPLLALGDRGPALVLAREVVDPAPLARVALDLGLVSEPARRSTAATTDNNRRTRRRRAGRRAGGQERVGRRPSQEGGDPERPAARRGDGRRREG